MWRIRLYINMVVKLCSRITIASYKNLKRLGHQIQKTDQFMIRSTILTKEVKLLLIKTTSAGALPPLKNKISIPLGLPSVSKLTNSGSKISPKVPYLNSLSPFKLKNRLAVRHLPRSSRWQWVHSFLLKWWESSSQGKFQGIGKGGPMAARPPSGPLLSFLRMIKSMDPRYSGEHRISKIARNLYQITK